MSTQIPTDTEEMIESLSAQIRESTEEGERFASEEFPDDCNVLLAMLLVHDLPSTRADNPPWEDQHLSACAEILTRLQEQFSEWAHAQASIEVAELKAADQEARAEQRRDAL